MNQKHWRCWNFTSCFSLFHQLGMMKPCRKFCRTWSWFTEMEVPILDPPFAWPKSASSTRWFWMQSLNLAPSTKVPGGICVEHLVVKRTSLFVLCFLVHWICISLISSTLYVTLVLWKNTHFCQSCSTVVSFESIGNLYDGTWRAWFGYIPTR